MASRLVTFRIPGDLYEDFQKQCVRDGTTVSERLRYFIDDCLYPIARPEPTMGNSGETDIAIDASSQLERSQNTLEERLRQLRRAVIMVNKRLYIIEEYLSKPSQATQLLVKTDELQEGIEASAKEVDKLCGGHWS